MARYDKEHKEATRQRIIKMAGHRFKTDGIDGSGVATLMADAGLTNSAFYAHFASKDDLVANVVADQLGTQVEEFGALTPGREGLEEFLRVYLSPQHRDNPGAGCPSAALLDEIGRCTDATKDAYTGGARSIVDEIALRLAPEDPRVRARTGARAVHHGGGDSAAVPCAVRQELRRRGPRAGHRERSHVPSLSST